MSAELAAADRALAVSERNLQRVRQFGRDGLAPLPERRILRAPDYRALPWPGYRAEEPDLNARGSDYAPTAFLPPFEGAEPEGTVPLGPLEGFSDDGDVRAVDAASFGPGLRYGRALRGIVNDVLHVDDITPDLLRERGFGSRLGFVLLRDGRAWLLLPALVLLALLLCR